MIKEDYVTFEQAKLLKEKGFPQDIDDTFLYYDKNGDVWQNIYDIENNYYIMPNLSMVAKWLREEKKIAIIIEPTYDNKTSIQENKTLSYFTGLWNMYLTSLKCNGKKLPYKTFPMMATYEEALSEGINKALELI